MDQVYRVAYRTERGVVGSVLLVAPSPTDAVAKLRARDSVMASAPRVMATASHA